MNVAGMRHAIKGQYANKTWSSRVDRMPDDQVIAIYFRMLEDNGLKSKKQGNTKEAAKQPEYEQLSLF